MLKKETLTYGKTSAQADMILQNWCKFKYLWQSILTAYPIAHPGVILETEGSVWKIEKMALFHYKKVKKGTPNLTSLLCP